MGNAGSNPFDEAAQQEMKDVINETVGEFSKQYVLALAVNLYRKFREESGETKVEPPPRQLASDEKPPSDIHLEGFLTKQGIVRKNWKKRYFIVHPDYTITYSETKESKDKVKGKISLNGYYVEDFNDEKRPWTFHLKHWRRRNWYLQCENEEDYKKWKEVLKQCCNKAPNPLESYDNEVHRKTFQRAYLKMKEKWYGWSGYFYCTGSEAEMLSEFIMRRLRWGVIWRVNSKITGPAKVRNMIRDQIEKQVNAAVDAAAAGAWKAAVEARTKMEPELDGKIRENSAPLVENQNKAKDTMKEKLMGILDPVLEKVGKPLIEKVLNKAMVPIADAYIDLGKTWQRLVRRVEKHHNGDFSNAYREKWWVWYYLYDARQHLWKMQNDDTVRKALTPPRASSSGADDSGDSQDAEPSNDYIAWRISDELADLLKDALFTLSQDKDPKVTGPKLLNDVRLTITQDYRNFLLGVLQPNIMNAAESSLMELCRAIDENIPEVLRNFISAEEMVGEILVDVCSTMADRILREAAPPQLERIDKAWSEPTESADE